MPRPNYCARCGESCRAHTGSYCHRCGELLVLLTPRLDLRGRHVTMQHDGRTLIGTIIDQIYTSERGVRLAVRHFNGEPWPFEWVNAADVTVLERTYDKDDA